MESSNPDRPDSRCPTDEQLTDFAAGKLTPQQIDKLASHVEHCPLCEAKLAKLDEVEHSSIDDLVKAGDSLAYAREANCEDLVQQLEERAGADLAFDRYGRALRSAGSSRRQPPPALTRVGPYELADHLGQGAMGSVYVGRHADYGTKYAIKLVHPRKQGDEITIERFRREMEAVGQLDHPNIVRAIDAGEEGGVQYLVMEYVDGIDLSRLSSRHGALGVAEASELVRQAALGLDHAHRHGRVHRDVKPSNLMLGRDGTVKLLDLGLARLLGTTIAEETAQADGEGLSAGSTSANDLTRTHQVMGTLGYIAPEQASDSHAADARADIYSLGCTLYKLLAGRAPFEEPQYSTAVRQLMAHAHAPVPPIREQRPDVPELLAAVLDRMLAKAPEQRFATAAEVAQALEPFARDADLRQLIELVPDRSDRETDGGQVKTQPSTGVSGERRARRGAAVAAARARLRKAWLAGTAAGLALIFAGVFVAPLVERSAVRQGADNHPKTGSQPISVVQPPPPPPTAPIDLLALIVPERDGDGKWTWADKQLVCNALRTTGQMSYAMLQIPYEPPVSYRIEAVVERLEGPEGPSFGVVVKNRHCLMQIDNWPDAGYLSGPHRLDGAELRSQRARAHQGRVLPDRSPVRVVCTVDTVADQTTLKMEAGDREIFTWKGKSAQVDLENDCRPPTRNTLFLRVVDTRIAFSELRLVPLSGGGRHIQFADPKSHPDLAAVQRILWKGGRLTVSADGSTTVVGNLGRLPHGFILQGIELPPAPWFSIGDLGYLSNLTELRELNLAGRALADSPLELRGLTHLERLDLSGTDVTSRQLSAITDSRQLRRLDLSGTPIGDEALGTILQLAAVEDLRLPETGMTDARVARLAALKKLSYLKLDHTPITDRAIESLASMPSLTSLSVNGTELTDSAVAALRKLPNLRHVSMLGTKMTRTSIERLESDRPQCQFVHGFKKLNLLDLADAERGSVVGKWQIRDGVLITPEVGGAAFRLPVVPPAEYDLDAVVRRETRADSLVFTIVVDGRQTMVGFDHQPGAGSYVVLHALDGKHELKSDAKARGRTFPPGKKVRVGIRVRYNRITVLVDGQTRLEWQGDFSRLGTLNLYGPGDSRTLGLGDWGSRFAVSEWTLTPVTGQADIVSIGPNRFTSERELAKRVQSLGGKLQITTGGASPDDLDATESLPDTPLWVREISLPLGSRLTAADFPLLQRTHDLKVLRLNGAELDPSLLAGLRDLKWLKSIELNDTNVTVDWASQIAQLPRLETIGLQRAPKIDDSLWQVLAGLESLRSLDLADSIVGDEAAVHVARMKQLRRLNLSGTRVTNATVQALSALPNLIELDLSRTAVTDASREAFRQFKELRRLNVKDSGLSFQAAEELRTSLPGCTIDGPLSGILVGKTEPLHPVGQAGTPVDLLALLNIERDAVPGTWEFDGKTLVSKLQTGQVATLKIPYVPPSEYRFEAVVECVPGVSGIQLGLPVGNHCFMELDGHPSLRYLSGPYLVDGVGLERYPTRAYRGKILPDSGSVRVSCSVLRAGNRVDLCVTCEGKEFFTWRGDSSSLSLDQAAERGLVAPGALGFRTWYPNLRISELRLIPIAGRGREIRFAEPAEDPELAAAQRVLWKGGSIDIDVGGRTTRVDTFSSSLPPRFTIGRIATLGRPCFTGSDLKWLCNLPQLQELDLSNVPLDTADLAVLAGLPKLESLKVAGAYLEGGGVMHLKRFSQLRKLDLSGTAIDEAAPAAIGQMANLRELRLASSTVSDDGVARLSGLTNLIRLDLDGTNITDRAGETLRRMSQLTELSVQGTSVSDASTDVLASLAKLRSLRVLDTRMTEEAISRFRRTLASCQLLAGSQQAIDLLQEAEPTDGSIVGQWDMVNGRLVCPASIPANFRLPVIPPDEYDMEMTARRTEKWGPLISVIVAGGRRAMVSFDHYGDHVILHQLDGKNDLASEAKTKRRTFPTGAEVNIVIRVRRNHITVLTDGVTALDWQGDFGRLSPHGYFSPGPGTTLGVSSRDAGFVISRWVLKPLSGSPHFLGRYPKPAVLDRQVAARVLQLGGSVKIDVGGTQPLQLARDAEVPKRAFQMLEIEGLAGVRISEDDFRGFGQLSHLQRLNLENAMFEESSLALLAGLDNLFALNLNGTIVTDRGLVHLSPLHSLRWIHLGRTVVTGTGFQQLLHLHDIEALQLGGSKLTLEGYRHIVQFKKLRHLDLSGSQIGDDDLAPIVEMSELRYLHVGFTKVTGPGLVHLVGLNNLETLHLDGAAISDDSLRYVGKLGQLRNLRLWKVNITDAGLEHLASLSKLGELDLTETKVTEQGATKLLERLPQCTVVLGDKRLTASSGQK